MVIAVHIHKSLFDMYCGRGTPLGNPYRMSKESDRDTVCGKYEEYFYQQIQKNNQRVLDMLSQIEDLQKGQTVDVRLGCFCKPKRCHCDTIASYINNKLESTRNRS